MKIFSHRMKISKSTLLVWKLLVKVQNEDTQQEHLCTMDASRKSTSFCLSPNCQKALPDFLLIGWTVTAEFQKNHAKLGHGCPRKFELTYIFMIKCKKWGSFLCCQQNTSRCKWIAFREAGRKVSVPYGQSNIATSIIFKFYILVNFKYVKFYNVHF